MNWLHEAKKRCEVALEPGILATCIQDTEDALRDLPKALELLEQVERLLIDLSYTNQNIDLDKWRKELEK